MATSRDPEGTKKRILQEAEKQFALVGPFEASVNVIAEKAQINKRMIYHYFGSKEDLYKAVLKKNLQKIYEMETSILEKEGNLIDNVREGIKDYYYFLRDNPDYVKLIAWENIAGGDLVKILVRENLMLGYERIERIYQRGVKEGTFRGGLDVFQIVLSINALCFTTFARKPILQTFWDSEIEKKLEERLEHICDLVLSMLTIPAAKG